ncbi:MAG: hypothetical protein WBY53_20700 [Acidobacteriaceae bacterium]
MVSGTDLQRQTLQLYGELMARRPRWAGALVFSSGAGVAATGLPAAVSIAGGTSLLLDSDAAGVKAVFRQGGVDFVVNTLDEALRVLKNEIRKHRPLSVALEGPVEPALAEMQERGVLPDLQVRWDGVDYSCAEQLQLVGMESSPKLAAWLRERKWTDAAIERATAMELRELDASLLAQLPEDDAVRRAWVQRIAHYQRPVAGGARVVWLTEAEREAL